MFAAVKLLTFHQSGKLLLLRVRQTHYALVFGALLGSWARLRQPQFTRLVEGQYLQDLVIKCVNKGYRFCPVVLAFRSRRLTRLSPAWLCASALR